jgi:hypothetical protein
MTALNENYLDPHGSTLNSTLVRIPIQVNLAESASGYELKNSNQKTKSGVQESVETLF